VRIFRVVSRSSFKQGHHRTLRMVVELAEADGRPAGVLLEALRKPTKGPWYFAGRALLSEAEASSADDTLNVAWATTKPEECST